MTTKWNSKFNLFVDNLQEHIHIPLFATAYTLIANQVISSALGMLYWTLSARLYSAEVVGQNSALISTILLLSALAEFSLKAGMGRFITHAGQKIKQLIFYTYSVNTVAATVITIVFFKLGSQLNFTNNLLADTKYLPLTLIFVPIAWTIFYVQDGVLTGMRQAKWVLYENQFYNIIKILLLIGLFLFAENRYGIFISWFLPVPFIIIYINWLIFFRFISTYLKENDPEARVTFKQVTTSVGGDHIGTLLSEAGIRILPLFVLNTLGKDASAYFYQAWLIGNAIYLIAYNFASSFAVEASANRDQIMEISKDLLIQKARLIVPLALGVFVFARLGLSIFGKDYAEQGTTMLRWLSLAALPMIINIWYLGYARITGKITGLIRNQGLSGLMTVGLAYFLMPSYGISGVGFAWFATQMLIAFIVAFEFRDIIFSFLPVKKEMA